MHLLRVRREQASRTVSSPVYEFPALGVFRRAGNCRFADTYSPLLNARWDVDKPMAEHVGRVNLQHLVEAQSASAGAIPVPRCPCATCPGVVFPPLVEFVNYLIGVHHVPLARVASRAAGDVDNILAAWDGNPATLAYSVKRKVGVKADKKRAAKRRVGNGNEEEADNERCACEGARGILACL